MPKAFRQRGKKKKATAAHEGNGSQDTLLEDQWVDGEQSAGPSWIISAPKEDVNLEAPFGYVDADVKAYFRTVDEQLREWQEADGDAVVDGDEDPYENRRMFLMAALQEMTGKERELATDPDCSTVLERMLYSMDDFVRRVFMDSLSGSYEQLSKHRFASHVVQTLLTSVTDTVARESRGVYPKLDKNDEKGELRTATQLVLDIAEELLPTINVLVLDPFASHVTRALFACLYPNVLAWEASILRSKKSAAWKAKQGEFKPVVLDERGKGKSIPWHAAPSNFGEMARRLIEGMRNGMDANEVRSLATNKASSPVLQMALQVEADLRLADEPDSLMDCVLVGMITLHKHDPSAIPEESDYLGTLLRDTTSSHLLETIVSCCPEHIFPILWSTYFEGKLGRLAVHPVANFVVAKAIGRISAAQLESAVEDMSQSWKKIRTTRPGVLRALIQRASSLHAAEHVVCEAICTAFELLEPDGKKLALPCILLLQTPEDHHSAMSTVSTEDGKPPEVAGQLKKRPRKDIKDDPLEPKVAGALILQSLVALSEPHNALVLDSLQAMSMDDIIAVSHHAISSRVLDAVLDSPTVSPKQKRIFLQRLIGHYHQLVDDRIGSRVGDRCWATADTFLKEKIARSLIPHETFLAGSFYGKFFARHLNLYLLQRRPDEWRDLQTNSKTTATKAAAVPTAPVPTPSIGAAQVGDPPTTDLRKKRKRPEIKGDEIDALFDGALGRKVKRAALETEQTKLGADDDADGEKGNEIQFIKEDVVPGRGGGKSEKKKKAKGGEEGLEDVLSAISTAPKGEAKGRKAKKHKS